MESQTPGSPPSPPEQPPPSEAPWISPRLREKLEEETGGGPPRQGPSAWIGIVLAVLVIGGGLALLLSIRAGTAREKAEAERRAREAAAVARAESLAAAARSDSLRMAAAARAESLKAQPGGGASRRPAAERGAAAGAAATTAPAAGEQSAPEEPAERGPFGLDVGSYLVRERAASEQARLEAATGLKGRVVARGEEGGEVYSVVLGSFSTRAAADRRAESLVARGLVSQARTVPLSP